MIIKSVPRKAKPEPEYNRIQNWFAWRPVRLRAIGGSTWHHPGGWAWLETVKRDLHREQRFGITGPYSADVFHYYVDWDKLDKIDRA